MGKRGVLLAIGAGALLSVACDDGVADRVDNRWDCRQICDRFAECFTDEDNYDTDNCVDECSENALDDDFETKVDDCEECLDGRDSCAEDTIECAAECTGVVAQSQ